MCKICRQNRSCDLVKLNDASTDGRVALPQHLPSQSLASPTPNHPTSLFYAREHVGSQRCQTTSSTILSWTKTPSPSLMPKNPNILARSRILSQFHGLPRLNILHLQRNDREQMAMEDGNTPPPVLAAEAGRLYRRTRRGQTVSTKIYRISRLRAMGCMECTLRDLRARILPVPAPRP